MTMQSEPSTTERSEQPYVAVRATVTMATIGAIADRIPDVLTWLAAHGATAAGAPFLKYNVIDMEQELEVEAGALTTAVVPATARSFRACCLRAGTSPSPTSVIPTS